MPQPSSASLFTATGVRTRDSETKTGWRRIVRTFLGLFFIFFFLTACSEKTGDPWIYPLPEGLRAQVNMGSNSYALEVVAVEGPKAQLQFLWNEKVISEREQYRGLYSLSGSDGGHHFINDIDTDAIDALFPLKIGKDISFEGRTSYRSGAVDGALWVTMAVTDKTVLEVKDGRFDVFIIHISTVLSVEDRTKTVNRVLYYSPELGLPLKVIMSEGDNRTHWRITSLDMPPSRARRNRLGTVMI